jgi:hypothetical protein
MESIRLLGVESDSVAMDLVVRNQGFGEPMRSEGQSIPKFVSGQAPTTEGFEASVSYEDIHQRACRAGNSGDSFIATADFQRQAFVIDT